MYFTDSHIQGILLAFGIIYKAWLLCGALSPCLLPLLPMTLPGLPSAPNAPSATLPAEGTEFGVKAKPFICCCCYFLFLYVQSLSIFILCKKTKKFSYSESHNVQRQTQVVHFRATHSYPEPSHMALITL